MTALAPRPVRLSPWRRTRVLARRTLFRALQAVPGATARAVHDRWIDDTGRRDPRWRPAAALLFYRPIDLDAVTVPGGAGERLAVVGSRLERVLWWYGEAGYEAAEAARWRSLCARSRRIVEVGANIGYYAVVGANAAPRGAYTAVEALPETAAVLRRNLALNGLDHAVVVEGAVAGADSPAVVELALPDQEVAQTAPTGCYLVSPEGAGGEGVTDRAAARTVRVPTVDAAALLSGADLVKLDIEGAEAAVLAAAMPELLASRPVLLVEVLVGSAGLRGVLRELVGHGWHALDPGGHTADLAEGAATRDRDVLLVPEERLHDL